MENLGLQIQEIDTTNVLGKRPQSSETTSVPRKSRGASAKSNVSKKHHAKSKSIPVPAVNIGKINYAQAFEKRGKVVRTKTNSGYNSVVTQEKAEKAFKKGSKKHGTPAYYLNSISNTNQSYPRLMNECS